MGFQTFAGLFVFIITPLSCCLAACHFTFLFLPTPAKASLRPSSVSARHFPQRPLLLTMLGDVWAAVSRVSRALFQIDGNQKWKWHGRQGEAPSGKEAMASHRPLLQRERWQQSRRGLWHPHHDSRALINVSHRKSSCSQGVWRILSDPDTACCTVDQASFYRNMSPSASWHLQARQKFLSIKVLAGGSLLWQVSQVQEGGGRAAASTKTGEKKEEPVIIGFWCWYVEKSQFPVQCGGGKRGEHLWQLHCGMVGIWSGITSKIAWNIFEIFCICRERRVLFSPALESREGRSAEDIW